MKVAQSQKKRAGRPKKFDNQAERQKAYRARIKAKKEGLLSSSVIDLSEVKPWLKK